MTFYKFRMFFYFKGGILKNMENYKLEGGMKCTS